MGARELSRSSRVMSEGQARDGGGAVGKKREQAARGVEVTGGRKGGRSGGEAKREVVGEGAKNKEEAESLETEYELLNARLLQWRFARVRAEAALAARERCGV